ncbi:DUF3108 domain-containing protein [Anaeromyxobacter sp. PSR-1]|uniref:DUF3108 domain-containing protein n=1 Tax=unclassified Anaeromyxobacter TaxID=2620896 RepID=UPI0005DFE85A|nr:DUF3108 domain-containing protein [Anaeromyxobacter sp. PSR-1]GAO04978.1 hypothetical protein PSR1_03880 [Anaeromyxobacter sp. PSR-1]
MTKTWTLALAALLAAVPASRADAFAPGEETVFSVRYLNLPTGEGRIVVGQPEGDVWPVIFQAKTEGVAGFIDIREHLVSYWDATARMSRGSDLKAYEVGDYHVDSARFDRANGQATVVVQRKGKRKEKTFPIAADAHDLTSAFMWIRLQPLTMGHRYELPVVSGSKQFTLVAEVVGQERIETPAGTFPTLKVKVRTALEGKFSTSRDSYMWLSDDPRHILVRASADFAVGSIVATLKSYRPGGEVAAAR